MSQSAVLLDTRAHPRITVTVQQKQEPPGALLFVELQVSAPAYSVRAAATVTRHDRGVAALIPLLDRDRGTATFSIWGLEDYRAEGPLLTCDLAGDGLGHFRVDLRLVDRDLTLSDRFVTDQTCLRRFIADMQQLVRSAGHGDG